MASYAEEQLIGALGNEVTLWKERCERLANIVNSYGLNDDPILTEKDRVYLISEDHGHRKANMSDVSLRVCVQELINHLEEHMERAGKHSLELDDYC